MRVGIIAAVNGTNKPCFFFHNTKKRELRGTLCWEASAWLLPDYFPVPCLLEKHRASRAEPHNEYIVACGSDVIPTKRSFHNENLKLLDTQLLALSIPCPQSCVKSNKQSKTPTISQSIETIMGTMLLIKASPHSICLEFLF